MQLTANQARGLVGWLSCLQTRSGTTSPDQGPYSYYSIGAEFWWSPRFICKIILFSFCRSKLGSLFGMDQSMSQGGNESLQYKAPKEPKKARGM